ncbi:hypothetical protein GTP44_03965 [Duganella sp. FT50W]|uniref:Uncharacterized protein n=1 Tax=Duganella lactea TaxID=2692173 RepID=A0A6L8MF50_9BURK|nr:hypothetical protein [Duganella lactea]MYM81114.1 hypothetical protein [Duganella lactea]
MTTQHQQQPDADDEPMAVEPAHVMTREKHRAREHYEQMLRELEKQQQK